MVQPAQDRLRNYVSKPLDWPCARRVLPKRNMRYNSLHIYAPKVLGVEYSQMVQALAPDRPDQALNMPVLPGRPAPCRSCSSMPSTRSAASLPVWRGREATAPVSPFEYGVSGKWLELLKQIAPQVTRAAVLRDPTILAVIGQLGAIQAVAPARGVEVHPVDLRDAGDVERAVTASVRASNGGLIVTVNSLATIHRAERLICQGQIDALHLEQALVLLHQRVPRLREDAGSARRDPRGWANTGSRPTNSGMRLYFGKFSGATARKISHLAYTSGMLGHLIVARRPVPHTQSSTSAGKGRSVTSPATC